MRTYSPKASELEHNWWIVDADGQTLGRLASLVASKIRGKDKPTFAPHMDGGDFVIVVNASRIRVTGRKMDQKLYYKHSGYPGGLTTTNLAQELDRHPDRVIEKAVRGMLPKSSLGDKLIRKLKVYGGSEHPHKAQQAQVWTLLPEITGAPAVPAATAAIGA